MNDSVFLKKLGAKIQGIRESQDMSRENLAEKIGISRMNIYRIELGQNSTSIIVLRKISKALEVPLAELIDIK